MQRSARWAHAASLLAVTVGDRACCHHGAIRQSVPTPRVQPDLDQPDHARARRGIAARAHDPCPGSSG
eukprot:3087073-Alexandrium_andersonii.AAC.1